MLISRGGRRAAASGAFSIESTIGPSSSVSPSISPSVSHSPSASPSPSGSVTGFFVATTGNNANAGSEASPWQTLKYALAHVAAGDTIWVRGGTHSANCHQAGTTAWATGTSFSSAITIRPYPGETVNITAQVGCQPPVNPTAYYHIWQDINFLATGAGANPFYGTAGATYIRLLDCTVSNGLVGGQGVHQATSDCNHWELIGCDIYNNGTDTNLDHGCYISGSDNLIDGCLLHGNRHYGVQFYPTSVNNVIRNTKVYSNKRGVVFYNGSGNLAYNNLIYGHSSDAIGATGQTGIGLYHNTVYNNGNDGIALFSNTGGTIRNNISYLNVGAAITAGGATSDHNVTANPSFTNAGASDFTLTAGSTNCINQGLAVGTVTTDILGVTRGNPPDIGAYEF